MKKTPQNADFRLHERDIFSKCQIDHPWYKKMVKTCIVLPVNPGKKITAVAQLCPFTFSRLIWSYCGGEGWKAFGK